MLYSAFHTNSNLSGEFMNKALIIALSLMSLNAFAHDLSKYSAAELPEGTKITFKSPIGFQAGSKGGYLLSNKLYIELNTHQDQARILKPRTCVVDSITPLDSGHYNSFNFSLKLKGEKPNDKICESIKLIAESYTAYATGENLNATLQNVGIELVAPAAIEL